MGASDAFSHTEKECMSDCMKCGAAARYHFRALEVHTLHIRDLSGEKRVQALGEVVRFSVCESCAREQLQENLKGVNAKALASFTAILIFGIVILALFWNGEGAFCLCGAAGAICGVLGIVYTEKESRQRSMAYNSLSEEKALEKSAWEVAVGCADHKCGDHDLSYIPITPETIEQKNGDLMINYDLLPDTAVQAWNILHDHSEKAAGLE